MMLAMSTPASAEAQKKAKAHSTALEAAMDKIQWGSTPEQVFKYFKKKIEEGYQRRIGKATDAIEEDYLREQMRDEIGKLRNSYFEFNGRETGHDSGFLKGEFTHNNGESMMRIRSKNADDYFFFINNKLWKRYRAFHAEVFEGASFEQFGDALQARYGKATVKRGQLTPGGDETQWYSWKQRRVWARAVDHTKFYGFYCLSLEDPKTVRQLAKLRTHKPSDNGNDKSIVDLVVGKDADDDMHADIADRISGEIRNKPGSKPEAH